jgi:hypothetical protein
VTESEKHVRSAAVLLLKNLEAVTENSKLKHQQQLAFVA